MQLGSLRQLTLISFVVVLVPLALLVGYSQIKLSEIGQIATNEAEYSVNTVRRVSKMEGLSVDIERLVRQYHIVKKDALKPLIGKSSQRFTEFQIPVCEKLTEKTNCSNLTERVDWINQYSGTDDQLLLDAQLAEFKQNLYDLSAQVDSSLDRRIQDQQIYVSSVQQTQFWLTACLLGASFILIALGSKAILKPVSRLERIITAMSRQEDILPEIATSGPKELIVLEQKLHRLAGRLIQLENLRHALLRHASHELKTPLASIKEGCSLLTEQVVGPLNTDQEEVLSLLNSSTDRLNLLIVQLLDYNLLLQQAKPVFSKINSERFFNEFVTENSLAIKQHDNQIDMKLELATVFADQTLFRRILDNLVSNAIAHGSKGSPINIRLYQKGNMQVLDFANRGQQIDMDQRHILFQPFSRGEGVRNDRVTGSGLGLSIVADCARMMFGKAEMVEVDYADVCIRVQIPGKEASI
ncbi:sensor histidine kinase [Paraglaciecola psychrophila]|uniref:histidine kinase n=1 Tax=Paraglaciecola psychrophila 170 TaxID=1129794 RepID=K6ZQ86_9ALTE|nr:HAMP domain-containing sensor histidine kinase [Paraglaciecola psychrophila]AGH45448.1 sensor signal transduction histidine kinase [Paraglaciecola psychrophila 170]GAC38116.1 two-component system, NtrC family, sensor histidine kinase YfhK [Paraglaciecola psychrophila 170]